MSDTTITEADLRPGERLLYGRPYVFNADLLNDHLAREAVANPPADLKVLTVSELLGLQGKCGRVWALERGAKGPHDAVGQAIIAELARRGLQSTGEPVRGRAA